MPAQPLAPLFLALALFFGPFGVYAYALERYGRPLPAFAAGSGILFLLIALVLLVTRV
jgi:hypothetical protein